MSKEPGPKFPLNRCSQPTEPVLGNRRVEFKGHALRALILIPTKRQEATRHKSSATTTGWRRDSVCPNPEKLSCTDFLLKIHKQHMGAFHPPRRDFCIFVEIGIWIWILINI